MYSYERLGLMFSEELHFFGSEVDLFEWLSEKVICTLQYPMQDE